MGLTLLETVTLLVAGMMTGNELCAGIVSTVFCKQEDRTHFEAQRALGAVFGAIMPFWYASTLLLTGAVAFSLRAVGTSAALAGFAALLWLLSIIYSVIGLVPINNRNVKCDWETRPPEWKQARQQWDVRHVIRIAILTLALACLILACLLARTGH